MKPVRPMAHADIVWAEAEYMWIPVRKRAPRGWRTVRNGKDLPPHTGKYRKLVERVVKTKRK